MHFFNPPALMKLVEVVATARLLARRRWRRRPRSAGAWAAPRSAPRTAPASSPTASPAPSRSSRCGCSADGVADAATIDRVCRLGGGFRMGPFELIDLIGLDVNLSVARSFYAQGGEPERWRPSPIQEELVAEGRLGPQERPRLLRLRRRAATRERRPRPRHRGADPRPRASWRGSTRRRRQILPRLFAQIANEAAFALEEEVGSPEDMDTAMRLGFNWPLGPLEITELIGAAPRGRACSRSCGRARRGLPRRRPPPARRQPKAEMASGRRPATRAHRGAEPRGRRRRCRRRRATRTSTRRPAASSPPSTRRRSRREDGRVVWELESYDFLDGDAARHRPPEPLAPGAAQPHRRPLRAGAGLLPAARLRPLEHARGRGRARGSSSSTRWSPPRRPPRRSPSTASTAASARSPA